MEGFISHYWEQGMEEEERLVFQDEAHVRRQPEGGERWAMEGMWSLEPGASLTIFAPEGHVLWSGVLVWRRTGCLGLGAPTLVPAGIEQKLWHSWFHHEPPLRARYTSTR